jgi:hypothetical protein
MAFKILLTGASGYMLVQRLKQYGNRLMENSGGSVLHQIKSAFKDQVHVSALVRSITARDAVMGMQVNPIHFDGLHDLVTIEKAASQHDSKS